MRKGREKERNGRGGRKYVRLDIKSAEEKEKKREKERDRERKAEAAAPLLFACRSRGRAEESVPPSLSSLSVWL